MKVLIVGCAELIPVVPVLVCVFQAITLTWSLNLYPQPADAIISHRAKSLHGLLNPKHDGKRRIIYDYTIEKVVAVKCHEILEVIVF